MSGDALLECLHSFRHMLHRVSLADGCFRRAEMTGFSSRSLTVASWQRLCFCWSEAATGLLPVTWNSNDSIFWRAVLEQCSAISDPCLGACAEHAALL